MNIPCSTFACMICDDTLVFNGWEHEKIGVCDTCAEKIANYYWHAHSFQYLTWDEDGQKLKPSPHVKKPIPEELRWQVFERDCFTCRTCGSRSRLRADHVIPEIKGGKATLDNLQTLCVSCNSRKGSRHVD